VVITLGAVIRGDTPHFDVVVAEVGTSTTCEGWGQRQICVEGSWQDCQLSLI
jgi:hypothetical protein